MLAFYPGTRKITYKLISYIPQNAELMKYVFLVFMSLLLFQVPAISDVGEPILANNGQPITPPINDDGGGNIGEPPALREKDTLEKQYLNIISSKDKTIQELNDNILILNNEISALKANRFWTIFSSIIGGLTFLFFLIKFWIENQQLKRNNIEQEGKNKSLQNINDSLKNNNKFEQEKLINEYRTELNRKNRTKVQKDGRGVETYRFSTYLHKSEIPAKNSIFLINCEYEKSELYSIHFPCNKTQLTGPKGIQGFLSFKKEANESLVESILTKGISLSIFFLDSGRTYKFRQDFLISISKKTLKNTNSLRSPLIRWLSDPQTGMPLALSALGFPRLGKKRGRAGKRCVFLPTLIKRTSFNSVKAVYIDDY
jgi:hypothetical protein